MFTAKATHQEMSMKLCLLEFLWHPARLHPGARRLQVGPKATYWPDSTDLTWSYLSKSHGGAHH